MIVYRIGHCKYIEDLTGNGAALHGGRWNSKNVYIVYTAQSSSLALLEAVVHIGRIPAMGYCMATIEIPEASIEVYPLKKLPGDWNINPAPDYRKAIGDNFIRSGKHLALKIPSVIIAEEHNYLLNPAHAMFNKVRLIGQKPIRIDERLLPS